MAILTGSKPAGAADLGEGKQGSQYPENAAETTFGRLEPLLQPEQLVTRFLFAIPLTSKFKDPNTGKPFTITPEMMKDYINLAVDTAEVEAGITIMPTQYVQKLEFQKQDFEAFGFWKLPRKPIASIEALNVTLADGSDVFVFPTEWIETSNLIHGQLNIIPLAFQGIEGGTGIVGGGINAGGGTAVFFNSLWNRPWVAALFGITYTAGFKDGMLPFIVNELIGTIAAMRILSMLAATYARSTSQSLGIDGMSQSTSGPGPQIYKLRLDELKEQRALAVKKLKKLFGNKIFSGTV